MVTLAAISQSRPMATPGPITLLGADARPAADLGARADHHARAQGTTCGSISAVGMDARLAGRDARPVQPRGG